ncbi:serpin family protein [Polaribacter cellanae]|uniref:Serpin family protein n=1 Tax=Polaribacter cellanae TaxID=2818493 RepID=A0A975CPQ1_9FLAO|nr:serpin family protein [Polaribacter cellanae]QTE21582.1 serpin family protein [Polaribacter cellanae]
MNKTLPISLLFFTLLLQSCFPKDEKVNLFSEIKKGEEFVTANNKFAFDFFKKISKKEDKENYMISPVSLSLALGMAYNGTANKTKEAFEQTLNYTSFLPKEINTINKEIIRTLANNSTGALFQIANSIWIEDSFPVKESFISTNKKFYSAEVEKLDFSDTNSANIINNWVSDKTYQKIPKIINKINSNDVLFLINAIYFKSDWKYTFKEEDTKVLPFYGENKTENVKMMHLTEKLDFYENTTFTAVKLPYKNNKYSMTILLPKEGKKTTHISNLLDINNWKNWKTNFNKKEVQLAMPKFAFSYEKTLNNTLLDLGLGVAFKQSADFSKISNIPVSISYVMQKTFIEVNEKGTEAAAVTNVGIGTLSINPYNILKLNKPFLFVITEKETGSISFIGKIGMPKTN